MNTVAYILILIGFVIIRSVSKGRMVTDIPDDLGDMFVALVTSDTAAMREVLARSGDTNTPSVASSVPISAAEPTPLGNTPTVSAADKAGLVAFGKQLQEMGYRVSEHPAFGGVEPVHVRNSQHYRSEAIDVNADTGFRGGEKAALDNANKFALNAGFKTLWQVAGHYDHLHVAVKK